MASISQVNNFLTLKKALQRTNDDINRFRIYKHLILEELDAIYNATVLPSQKVLKAVASSGSSSSTIEYKKIELFFEERGLKDIQFHVAYVSDNQVNIHVGLRGENVAANPRFKIVLYFNWTETYIDECETTECPIKVTTDDYNKVLLRTPFWEDVVSLFRKKGLIGKKEESEKEEDDDYYP